MLHAALVLEGGSFRTLFTGGVLDIFLEAQLSFAYVNGVSAGSLCGLNYVAKQPGRTREINETFCADPRYLGFGNLLRTGGVFNFHFMFGEICDALYPMDRRTLFSSPQRLEAVATDLLTGKPLYVEKSSGTPQDFLTACCASSSMPGLAKTVSVGGIPCLDGGCSCAVAYHRAAQLGYDKIVVVLTRPKGYRNRVENSSAMNRLLDRKYRRYPAFCRALHEMPRRHNHMYEELEQWEREGRVFLLCPEKPVQVSRLERDAARLEELYQQGRAVAMKRLDDMMHYLHT